MPLTDPLPNPSSEDIDVNLNEGQNDAISSDAANAPSDEQEFDAALAELASPVDTPAAAAVDGEAGNMQEGAADNRAPASAAVNDAPAAAQAPAGDAPQTQDIWSSAPPELRTAFEQYQRDSEYRLEASRGRQAALDKQIADLRKQLSGQQPAAQQEGTQDNPGASGQEQQPKTDHSEIASRLREDFPDLAAPILDLIEKQASEISELKGVVAPVQQERLQSEELRQQEILTQAVPDWADAVRDDRFMGWLANQPTSLRTAFERNSEKWVDGADAALVIRQFKQDVGFGSSQAPTPTPTPQDDRRQRQLANGRDAGMSSPSVSSSGPDERDFDAWVDVFGKKTDQRSTRF